jgi:dTDP-4-dehydrorhamnose reductase
MQNRDIVPHGKILVVGGQSMLGRGVIAALRTAGRSVETTSRRSVGQGWPVDLAMPPSSWVLPRDCDLAYVCAAVTAAEDCVRRPDYARAVNVDGVVELSRRLVQTGCRVVFLSSNAVFDGMHPSTNATAPVAPQTVYGAMKAAAENQILALGPGVCVARFAKVLGPRMQLVDEWSKTMASGKPIRPFSDLVFAPVSVELAVRVLLGIGAERPSGVVQFSADHDVSYAQVARRLATVMGASEDLVQPVDAHEVVRLEHVPRHTTLDATTVRSVLGLRPPSPWQAIEPVIAGAVTDADGATTTG